MNNSQALQKNKMGTEPIVPLIIKMSLPAMFSMLIQALYNVVDSVFLGYYGQGSEALTAVSLAYPLQLLLIAFVVGTGVGINSLIARRLGEGDVKNAQNVAMTGIILGVATWIVFALMGIFASRPFITFMAGSENTQIIDYGVEYIFIVLVFSLGIFIQVMIEKSIQATGNMIIPMASHLIGAVTNIVLDPIFIFGLGPIPSMGVKGAAIATVLGQWLSMLILVVTVCVKKFAFKFSFKGYKLSMKTIKEIYSVGLSGIVMQSIGAVLLSAINIIINLSPSPADVNTAAQTVYGLYFKIQSFIFMPVFGLNQGISPIMSFNYGAKCKERLLKTLKIGLIIAFSIMLLGTLLFQIIPSQILSLFDVDEQILSIGNKALRTISICFLPASVGVIFTALFQAVGKGMRSLLMSVLRQLVLIIPLAFVLSKISIDAMWFAFPISEFVAMVVAILFFIDLNKKDFSKLGK
ncbi:MAG: MATE family efflux transporter [Oscillospiraceae bacterium]|nr:MATE family efflux transporter [Oscillospiraceae bacterium]